MKNRYIQNPTEAIAKNSINLREAQSESMTDPIALGVGALGQLAMSYGISQGGVGAIPGVSKGVGDLSNQALMMMSQFGYGGIVDDQRPVNVEGKEVISKPDGTSVEMKGLSHDEGGIDVMLGLGDKVFSDRIEKDGKTMAEREKARQNRMKKFAKLMEKAGNDPVLKRSAKRTEENAAKEEESDLAMQTVVKELMKGKLSQPQQEETAAFGIDPNALFGSLKTLNFDGVPDFTGTSNDLHPDTNENNGFGILNPITPGKTQNKTSSNNFATGQSVSMQSENIGNLPGENNPINDQMGMSLGDSVGIGGNIFSAIAPLVNTMNSRATDTPNVNAFANAGEDSLAALDQAKGITKQQQDSMLQLLMNQMNGAKRTGRNGARGINTQRAMDLSADQGMNDALIKAFAQFSGQNIDIQEKLSSTEMMQDQIVMRGEQARDAADRADKDNYYTNKAENINGIGKGIQQTGKDLNQVKQNELVMKMLNQMSEYFKLDKNGNIINKED